jgi:copper chaperone
MEAVTYNVVGMTASTASPPIYEELSQVHGGRAVGVDLGSWRRAVTGEGFSDDAIEVAVEEAGYELVT